MVGGMHGGGIHGGGACMVGGRGQGGMNGRQMATAVGGTHPTGMQSCTCRILNTGPSGEWLHALQGTDRQNHR